MMPQTQGTTFWVLTCSGNIHGSLKPSYLANKVPTG